MFKRIFLFEAGYWLRQPITYIFSGFFFAIAMFSMAGTAGAFDPHSNPNEFFTWINSPSMIYDVTRKFNTLILVLLPSIIGTAIFRDYKSNMHSILYAFPIHKRDYYTAKFSTAILFSVLILAALIIGLIAGEFVPTIDPNKVGPTNWVGYLQVLFIFLIPNALLVGSIVFVVVAQSRNLYAGFIAAVLVLLINFIFSKVLGSLENQTIASLLDPLGGHSMRYYLQHWTPEDINSNLLPIKGVVIANRLIWIAFSFIVFWFGYRHFELEQEPKSISLFNTKKAKSQKIVPKIKVHNIPKTAVVDPDFSFYNKLKVVWRLTLSNISYIISQKFFIVFLVIGLVVVVGALSVLTQQEMTATYPVTWRMLEFPVFFFSGVINILTFLFAGMLIHRSRMANMDQLVDICPQPNWVFIVSNLFGLLAMQIVILFVILIGGILYQMVNGFYDIRLGQAIFELFILDFIHFSIYAYLALFVQSIFKNPSLGLFILVVILFAIPQVHRIGLDHIVFQYNQYDTDAVGLDYSELSGYGVNITRYLVYKAYWFILGLLLIFGASLLWIRGIPQSIKERIQIARQRFSTKMAFSMLGILTLFISFGFTIYNQEILSYTKVQTKEDQEGWAIKNEKLFGDFRDARQPLLTSVKLNVDLYNTERNFDAKAVMTFKNMSERPLDTLVIYEGYDEVTTFSINKPSQTLIADKDIQCSVLLLDNPLMPNDSFELAAHVQNEPNRWFRQSVSLGSGGTFFNNSFLPTLGYKNFDIENNTKRKENNLKEVDKRDEYVLPDHPSARKQAIGGFSTPWIHLDATISTSMDESAITVGSLVNQWSADDRNYFHYKTTGPVKNRYAIQSGAYAISEDQWNDVKIYVYHHPDHDYNIDRFFKGAKAALSYGTKHYGPYPHKEIRIVEFPRYEGTYATLLANTIPFSETRFIAEINDTDPGAIDFIFYVMAHELTHQWWGNTLNAANAKGSKILTEGITEYTTLQILEKHYGELPVQKFLKYDLDAYLKGRSTTGDDQALLYADPMYDFINYRKASVVLYALADYIGDDVFNQSLRSFMEEIKYQTSDFVTSLDFIDHIRPIIPDSLAYLVKDMLETITFYDISMKDVEVKEIEHDQFQVDIAFTVAKVRKDSRGKIITLADDPPSIASKDNIEEIKSLPLKDYIEVGLFTKEEGINRKIYLKKHLISEINNKVSIIVNERPTSIGVDPLNKLIDLDISDNKMDVN